MARYTIAELKARREALAPASTPLGETFPLNESQMRQVERDVQDFVSGRKRFRALKRWIETQDTAIDKAKVASHIADVFRHRWLNPPNED
jgi:hypothetical protein